MVSNLNGLFGTGREGNFHSLPEWIDEKKKPGASVQYPPSWQTWLLTNLKLKHIFFSPNFVWLCISIFIYTRFPYDFKAGKHFHWGWVSERLVSFRFQFVICFINLTVFILFSCFSGSCSKCKLCKPEGFFCFWFLLSEQRSIRSWFLGEKKHQV